MLNQLYEKTSAARFNVSSLQLNDLLKLDYKDCITSSTWNGTCGIASIMKRCTVLIEESTSEKVIAKTMLTFAETKNLTVVFGFCSKEKNGNKMLILCDASSSSSSSSSSSLCDSFVHFLHSVPENLSTQLKSEPILGKQQVTERGVLVQGTRPRKFDCSSSSECIVVEIYGSISRKSLKPITEEWMQSLQ